EIALIDEYFADTSRTLCRNIDFHRLYAAIAAGNAFRQTIAVQRFPGIVSAYCKGDEHASQYPLLLVENHEETPSLPSSLQYRLRTTHRQAVAVCKGFQRPRLASGIGQNPFRIWNDLLI